jgi:thymidylate synthase
MLSYLYLLKRVLSCGEAHEDRTGVGTTSLFGAFWEHEFKYGFPLITTKQVTLRGVFEELSWFLSGSTNVNDLHPRYQHWWKPWADEHGALGPIYGQQLRSARSFTEVEPLIFDAPTPEEMKATLGGKEPTFAGVGCIGDSAFERGQDETEKMLKDVWRGMLKRCYAKDASSYKSYGAKGVHVDPDWLLFDNFSRDAKQLPNWRHKRLFPKLYSIDKDCLFASNRYSKQTCKWSSHEEQSFNLSNSKPLIGNSPTGVNHVFPSIGDCSRNFGFNLSAVHRCLLGKLKTHHGWSFSYLQPDNGKTIRFQVVDQIANILVDLLENRESRRIVMSTWNASQIDQMRLPPCHGLVTQFKVHPDNTLSLHMYQRSCDAFIGLPVNIASYGLLLEMLCAVSGYKPRKLSISFGDLHIYRSHYDAVAEQLIRQPHTLPTVKVNVPNAGSPLDNLLAIRWKDIELTGYKHHPKIEAPVAV